MCYLLGKEPQSMRWGLVLGVEGNLRKVVGIEEPIFSGLRPSNKAQLDN